MSSEELNALPEKSLITLEDVVWAKEQLMILRSADSFHIFNADINKALGIAIQELTKTEKIWEDEGGLNAGYEG